jgi:RNA polymerase sigma-70 factor (ECF subfamily)
MNEEKLIKKAINGKKKAFEELLVIHSDRLYRTAYLYVGNREDALDVVQETAYKAFLAVGQLNNEKYFLTWLTKILIRSAYDTLRKKKRELPSEEIVEVIPESREKNDEHMDLVSALSDIKEDYRNAIILFYYQDLPIKEVATIMEVPENTVKTYLMRGKKQLKNKLGGSGYYEGEIVS